jgi:hypothetical protein
MPGLQPLHGSGKHLFSPVLNGPHEVRSAQGIRYSAPRAGVIIDLVESSWVSLTMLTN